MTPSALTATAGCKPGFVTKMDSIPLPTAFIQRNRIPRQLKPGSAGSHTGDTMPSIRETLELLFLALSAYRWRPFETLTASDIDALLED
jgi:hypothetical protein